MSTNTAITLDNKTIAKLAIAIATATKLAESEIIGPLTRKVLETLDAVDSSDHFKNHRS